MDLRDHITALAATADRIGLGYSRDAARAVHHHVDELRDALDEHALKVTAGMREALAAKDAEIDRLKRTIARGRVLHQPVGPHCPICDRNDVNDPACTHHPRYCGTCVHGWPCPTRAALAQPGDQPKDAP